MSEMLGNQYFMARKYESALSEFEECVLDGNYGNEMLKKMVVCYVQTGKIERAAGLLNQLIQEDLNIIINTDPVEEDCPCNELAFNLETKYDISIKSFDYLLALGVLWLYCDMNKSIEYFEKALQIKPDNKLVNSILKVLNKRKKQNSKLMNHYPS